MLPRKQLDSIININNQLIKNSDNPEKCRMIRSYLKNKIDLIMLQNGSYSGNFSTESLLSVDGFSESGTSELNPKLGPSNPSVGPSAPTT